MELWIDDDCMDPGLEWLQGLRAGHSLWQLIPLKNWMLILVLLCENERQRWDASQYIKACSEAQRFYVYRDTSHLWRSFSHNRTKINIQYL